VRSMLAFRGITNAYSMAMHFHSSFSDQDGCRRSGSDSVPYGPSGLDGRLPLSHRRPPSRGCGSAVAPSASGCTTQAIIDLVIPGAAHAAWRAVRSSSSEWTCPVSIAFPPLVDDVDSGGHQVQHGVPARR